MINEQLLIAFTNALEDKAKQKHPSVHVQLQRAPTGHYVVLMHLHGEVDCYTIDTVTGQWVKTYGHY